MLERQRKKFKSNEKRTLNETSGYYFRKNSPQKQKSKHEIQVKTFHNIGSSKKNYNLANQSYNGLKQNSFLKFIPATTKNISSGQYKDIKEIKIPSFFKKNNQKNSINQSSHNINSQKIKYQKKQDKVNINQVSLNGSSKYFQSIKTTQESKDFSESIEESKLNNKMNYLLRKINEMKENLDKKRYEKLSFLESQRKNRRRSIQDSDDLSTFNGSSTPLKQFITQVPQHKDLHAFAHNPYSPKNSVYYVSEILRAYRQQKSMVRQHIHSTIDHLRMFQSRKLPSEKQIEHMKVNLERKKGYQDKKTVVFDLDETLIHCNENMNLPSDFKIKINFPTGQIIQVGINVRPFARQILIALYKNFQVIVFTASHSSYANVVLDQLDPERKYIHHRLFRQSCYCTSQGIYVKDLRIINRPLEKMILIDNAAYSYAFQPLNGVPIIPYYEGKNDYELQALLKYIQTLIFSVDVREKNKKTFKLDQYHRFDDLNSLVETLYCRFQV